LKTEYVSMYGEQEQLIIMILFGKFKERNNKAINNKSDKINSNKGLGIE